jgi:acyl-CoA oxidase
VERPSRLTTVLELVTTVDGTLFTIMSIHYCLCAGSILRHATPSPEIERYLEELDSLESIGTFLATELGYGNNVVSLETRADYDAARRELRVSTPSRLAAKFMPNTAMPGVPKIGLVMARLFVDGTEHGVFPVLLRLSTAEGPCPGISITPLGEKPTYGLDNGITSFYGVRVSKACLLLGSESRLSDDGEFESSIKSRRERFLSSMEQVQLGRIGLSAVGAAMLGASSFIAIKYGSQRKTFAPRLDDVSVLAYRNYQRDVFTTLAYAYASRFMVGTLKRQYAKADVAHDETFRITSAAKAHVSYAVERFSRLCRERCGAAGLFEENRVAAYSCYAQGMITAEGDNQIVLVKIARQMMMGRGYTKLGKESAEMDLALADPKRLVQLLRSRERLLLADLRKATVQGLARRDMFASWNDNINLAIETASAHASRLMAESFWEGVRELHPESPLRALLSLFCLQEIMPHLGYYMAEGLFMPHNRGRGPGGAPWGRTGRARASISDRCSFRHRVRSSCCAGRERLARALGRIALDQATSELLELGAWHVSRDTDVESRELRPERLELARTRPLDDGREQQRVLLQQMIALELRESDRRGHDAPPILLVPDVLARCGLAEHVDEVTFLSVLAPHFRQWPLAPGVAVACQER